MERIFKIHASQTHKIMGKMGLTETQQNRLNELKLRNSDPLAKALTQNMKDELSGLILKAEMPELPQTAKTFLHEWYANDNEQVWSKYTDKGNMVEFDLIEFMAEKIGYGLAQKNQHERSDEYFIGSCDVEFPDLIVDVKAPWNVKTLHEQVISGLDEAYEMQLKVYCHLWNKPKGLLFFGLMDTPEEANYGNEIMYSSIPDSEKWVAYNTVADPEFIKSAIERVKLCRIYLAEYDKKIKSRIGKIH